MQLSNQPITWQLLQCIYGCGPGQDNLLNSKLNVRMGKKDNLSNFERITKAHVTGFDKLTFVALFICIYLCILFPPNEPVCIYMIF